MTTTYKLTLAIPTYNRKAQISVLLDSIYHQISKEVEVIVSDNNSTDGTIDLIERDYKWVTLYTNEKNNGPDWNFLNCYKKASGQYIMLIGSDDILVEGAIARIIGFIDKYSSPDMPVIYLNHFLFKNQYTGIQKNTSCYLKTETDYVLEDKNTFIQLTKARITFMSCFLMSKTFIQLIDNPEKYIGTSFIHTCILFEATKSDDLKFGMISYPCIAANATEGAEGLSSNLDRWFEVFSLKMHKILCENAIECGYSKKLMNQIYINEVCKPITTRLIRAKANNYPLEQSFRLYIYPVAKKYWVSWFTIIPSYFLPSPIANLIYYKFRPFLKRCLDRK